MSETNKENSSSRRFWGFGKRDLIEWGAILGIALTLYATGLHTEVLGRLQQVVLWTGIIQPDTEMPVSERNPVDLDMELISLENGQRLNLSDLRGNVIFINYWATWCPPCIAEMPNIQSLYERYSDRDNLKFVMVSMDEEAERATEFIARKEFTFPAYHLAGSRPPELQSDLLPTTFVINSNGNLVLEKRGMANYDTRSFRTFLDSLLAGSGSGSLDRPIY